jgi:hypothetical protein
MHELHAAFGLLSTQVCGRTQPLMSPPAPVLPPLPVPPDVPPELPPLVPPEPLLFPLLPPLLPAEEPPLPLLPLPLDEHPTVSHEAATRATHPTRIFRIEASKFFSQPIKSEPDLTPSLSFV